MMRISDTRDDDWISVSWIAVARLPDGAELPCAVKDACLSKLNLSMPAEQMLPEQFMLKVVGRDLVFSVRPAWRRGHSLGVSIERIAKLSRRPMTPAERLAPFLAARRAKAAEAEAPSVPAMPRSRARARYDWRH